MKRFIFTLLILLIIPIKVSASDNSEAIIEETETTFMDLQDAINNAKDGDVITLTSNVILTEKLTIPTNTILTINLNNKKLEVAKIEDNYGMVIKGNLTIKGNGTVIANGLYGLGVSTTGSLTIKGGTYKNETGDYLIGNWNNTTIENGTFYGNYCIINGFAGNTVKILDGTFYNNEPDTIILGKVQINGGTFNQNVEDYLADEMIITKKDNLYHVNKTTETFLELSKNKSTNKIIWIIIIILIPSLLISPKIYKTIKEKFILKKP